MLDLTEEQLQDVIVMSKWLKDHKRPVFSCSTCTDGNRRVTLGHWGSYEAPTLAKAYAAACKAVASAEQAV